MSLPCDSVFQCSVCLNRILIWLFKWPKQHVTYFLHIFSERFLSCKLHIHRFRMIHRLGKISFGKLSNYRNKIQSLDGDWGYLIDSLRSLHVSGNSISEMNFADDDDEYTDEQQLQQQIVSFENFICIRIQFWLWICFHFTFTSMVWCIMWC